MLARHLRLKHTQDFRAMRQQGRRYRTDLLILTVLPNELSHNRFGFVVSKTIGKATARNRIKRRLRAAVYRLLPDLQSGYDVVVAARRQAAEASYQQLFSQTKDLLTDARLYEDPPH